MNKILDYFKKYKNLDPQVCIILGSGLNAFTSKITNQTIIKYSDIPNFFKTSVQGHSGKFIFGKINDTSVLCAAGRFHYYEGYSFNEVSSIIDIFNIFNPKLCIITNSSGCLNLNWKIGDFMIANSFLDFSFRNSTLEKLYKVKSKYIDVSLNLAKSHGIMLREGTYTYTMGPTYETPAEVNEIIKQGGNAVGMSTFPEFLKCKKLKIDSIFLSCMTNYGAGLIKKNSVNHKDVLMNAKLSIDNFCQLLNIIIQNI